MRAGYAGETESIITRVWVDEMRKRGVEPVVISETQPTWDVEWQPLVVGTPRVKGLGIGRLMTRQAAREAVGAASIDLLHWHFVAPRSWGRFARPLVVSAWGSDVLLAGELGPGYCRGQRAVLRAADSVLCCAPHVRDAAIRLGARPSDCRVIGWGVDPSVFYPDEAARDRIRREWQIPIDARVVLSTRRLEPLYRHDLMIEAFVEAATHDSALYLAVASYGSLEPNLHELVTRLGISERVRFLGRVSEEGWPSMADVYRGGDVYCSIPRSDGAPLSVLEAMATGLPVVASDLPSMRDWVSEQGAGFLWADSSTATLSGLLLQALEHRDTLGGNALRYARLHQSRRLHMDKAFDVYERVTRRAAQ